MMTVLQVELGDTQFFWLTHQPSRHFQSRPVTAQIVPAQPTLQVGDGVSIGKVM